MIPGLFDMIVEDIARKWFERPCPPEDGDNCNPDMHDWDNAHPDDKENARENVRFTLRAVGFDG